MHVMSEAPNDWDSIIELESESEIFYLTIIHVQFIMKVIHLLNTEVKDDFC